MIPGGGEEQVPPPPADALAELGGRLDALEGVAADLERSLTAHLGERLATNERTGGAIATAAQGYVASRHAALDQQAGKVVGKLQKRLNQQLGQVYTYGFPYGITYPSTEQALYGLTSGDVMGSFGLAAPNVQLPPDAIVPPVDPTLPPVPAVVPPPLPVSGGTGSDALPNPFPVGAPPIQPGAVPPPPRPGLIGPPTYLPPAGPGATPPVAPGDPTCLLWGTPPVPSPPPPVIQPSPISGQPSCPPGMMYQPPAAANYGVYTVGIDPNPVVAGRRGPLAGGMLDCPPYYTYGWRPYYDASTSFVDQGVAVGWPWLNNEHNPPDLTAALVCVDRCHRQPGQPGLDYYYAPAGASLYVGPEPNRIVWAEGPLADPYVALPMRPCSTPAPGGGGPPVPAPAPAPGGGGTCVPIPPAEGTCKVPSPLNCGPDLNQHPVKAPLGTGDDCGEINDLIDLLRNDATNVADWLGMKEGVPPSENNWKEIVYAILGTGDPIGPSILKRLAVYLQTAIQAAAESVGAGDPAYAKTAIFRGVVRFVDRWTGIIPHQLMQRLEQVMNTLAPVRFPGVAGANRAYLADEISAEEWECWVKAEGGRVDPEKAVRQSERARPSPEQAQRLFRRQWITQDRYDQLTRQGKVIQDEDKEDLWALGNAWPGVGELTRWAGEFLFDDDTVERFKLDDEFDTLWDGRFKKWMEGHGVDSEIARNHWRAHWRRPGVSELLDMVRRLRPDKVDADLAFSADDFDAALRQEGFNDYWRKRLVAVAHVKPARRDAQRLYDYHLVDEEGLRDVLQDMGYEHEFAGHLVDTWKVQRQISEARFNGEPMPARLVADYAKGYISKDELTQAVAKVVYYPGQSDEIEENALQARRQEERRLAVQGLKAAFMKGLVGISDAQAQLAAKGMDEDAIAEVTGYWVRIQQSRPKQVAASTLCTWRKDGLISGAEQMAALTRLGYGGADASNIVADCTLKIQQANKAAEDKALKAAQRAAEKAAKAAEQAARNATRRVKVISPNGQKPA